MARHGPTLVRNLYAACDVMIAMRQTLFSSFALVAVFAALFGAGPGRVMACSCAGIQPTEQFARDMVEYSDFLVVGEVVAHRAVNERYGTTSATISIERSYGGIAPSAVEIITDDGGGGCGYGASLQQGGRHFMSLRENEDSGTYNASYCSSFSMAQADAPRDDYERGYAAFLETLTGLAPPVVLPDVDGTMLAYLEIIEPDDNHAPAALIVAYVAGSLVALGALMFVGSRVNRERGRS